LVALYTILPALALIYSSTKPGDPLTLIENFASNNVSQLGIHLWRHVLFILGISIGYLWIRGRSKFTYKYIERSDKITIISLLIIIIICIFFIDGLSAPVESYYDNYTRYDHLPVVLRKIVSILTRFKYGFYSILFSFLFLNYNKFKLYIPIIVFSICLYELIYSHGSRIIVLIILLQVFFLYNFIVKSINIKKALLFALVLSLVFSLVEVIRLMDLSVKDAENTIGEEGIKAPGEIGAVFFTGYHLYSERAMGALPKTEWPMFFYDFISPFSFNSFTKWNPIYWYADNYFPESEVPPFTLGPIADSAIWGGEIDLFLRGLVNGAFFAIIVKWFLTYRDKWWALTIYSFFFSTCVMTLKYSVFYHITPLFKDILPTIFIIVILRMFFRFQPK
jgi:hypothetical protein